jgi:hypothetical protein
VFESRVLRKMSGPKGEAVRGDSKLHIEEICDVYSPPTVVLVIKSRRMRLVGLVACAWDRSDIYTGFWWVSLKLLGRPRCRWDDNIKLDQFTTLYLQNAQCYALAV